MILWDLTSECELEVDKVVADILNQTRSLGSCHSCKFSLIVADSVGFDRWMCSNSQCCSTFEVLVFRAVTVPTAGLLEVPVVSRLSS